MEILRRPSGLTHTLRRMNQHGVLGPYIPAFGRIVGRMQHDLRGHAAEQEPVQCVQSTASHGNHIAALRMSQHRRGGRSFLADDLAGEAQ